MEPIDIEEIKSKLPLPYKGLAESLVKIGKVVDLPAGHEILREGQYVKFVPILLSGLVKVVTRGEMKDLLLYYIKPGESCVMSFIHALSQQPCNIYAIAEEPTKALIIPSQELDGLIRDSADFNKLFHELSNQRYTDLLDTINEVFFLNLEERMLKYLRNKTALTDVKDLNATHQEIARDLGTAREVVSRTLKKLENQGKIELVREGIRLL
ncbi:Crp/Fnr family transcriptional regulator [Roseivirga sp.]|uniref:Crp/Fnr family transcriptional regulator n=1 Tax=Roseivirga sp. TaxID=1964215 RepID=UPI003B51A955